VNNWKVIPTIVLATVLIFGAGVFTGGMLADHLQQSHKSAKKTAPAATNVVATSVVSTNASGHPKAPEILSKDFLGHLDANLHLTKEQHDCIQKIISDNQNAMRKVIQDARLEIRETLTPEQQQQFDELMKHPFHRPIFATNAPPLVVSTNSTSTPSTNAP